MLDFTPLTVVVMAGWVTRLRGPGSGGGLHLGSPPAAPVFFSFGPGKGNSAHSVTHWVLFGRLGKTRKRRGPGIASQLTIYGNGAAGQQPRKAHLSNTIERHESDSSAVGPRNSDDVVPPVRRSDRREVEGRLACWHTGSIWWRVARSVRGCCPLNGGWRWGPKHGRPAVDPSIPTRRNAGCLLL